jgi:hypothetical protein
MARRTNHDTRDDDESLLLEFVPTNLLGASNRPEGENGMDAVSFLPIHLDTSLVSLSINKNRKRAEKQNMMPLKKASLGSLFLFNRSTHATDGNLARTSPC